MGKRPAVGTLSANVPLFERKLGKGFEARSAYPTLVGADRGRATTSGPTEDSPPRRALSSRPGRGYELR
jgi:hypothetical protein